MALLVVQMGHAGRTTGATGAPGEQAYTQAVGAECARQLNRDGWQVRLIVADPADSAYRGDAFFAIHADGSSNPDGSINTTRRGASVGYQNDEGAGLAHAWRDAYVRRGFTGPWHEDNYTANLHYYYGVSKAIAQGNRRACIVECGTITNAEDRALMDPARVAAAIGDALGIGAPIEEADVQPTDRVVFPYPYQAKGDSFEVREAMGFPLYITADMAKDDAGVPIPPGTHKTNRLSIPALRDDVDALHDKLDELAGLVRRALGGSGTET